MEWPQALAAAELRLKELLLRRLAQLFLFTQVASVNSTGATAVESSDQGVDPGAPSNEKKSQRPVTSIFPFGFISVPERKLRALALRLGTSNVLLIGIAATQKHGPQDLAEGESAIYNITSALIRLWKTGKVTVDADTGQDFVVNGGTLQVARKTDKTVADATMTTWIGKVTTVAAAIDSSIVAPTDFGVINGGAAHFKG